MRISYDPEADAIYVTLKPPTPDDRSTVAEDGTIIDLDPTGQPRGFEFLMVRSHGVPVASLPDVVARAVERFISSGALKSGEFVQWADDDVS